MDGAPALQVPERFPVAPAPKQSAPASSVADNRVSLHPCEISERRVGSCGTHPFRFLTEEKLQPKLFIVNT